MRGSSHGGEDTRSACQRLHRPGRAQTRMLKMRHSGARMSLGSKSAVETGLRSPQMNTVPLATSASGTVLFQTRRAFARARTYFIARLTAAAVMTSGSALICEEAPEKPPTISG